MSIIRDKIPATIVSIVILLFVAEFFMTLPDPVLSLNKDVKNFGSIVAAFAILLGTANILRIYGGRIIRGHPDRMYAGVLLLSLFITIAVGLQGGKSGYSFLWIYNNMYVPLGASVFSLLGFFIVSAAFRAFRARTLEATILLLTAGILIWWGAPLGHYIFPGIDPITMWVLNTPNRAAWGGFIITSSIAIIGLALNYLLQKQSAFAQMKEQGGEE